MPRPEPSGSASIAAIAGRASERSELRFPALGTQWRIDSALPLGESLEDALIAEAERFDADWSRFRDDSPVRRLAREGGEWAPPAEADALLRLYLQLEELTDGAVTPLVGRRLEHLGYGPGYRLTADPGWRGEREPAGPRLAELMQWDGEVLRLSEPALLDIGAAGKGLLVDLLGEMIIGAGHEDFCVDASGDLLARGEELSVGLEDPRDHTRAIGLVRLRDRAICASGTGRRSWGPGLHHILDGRTGQPTEEVSATWAVAETAMLADGATTALFFLSPAILEARMPVTGLRLFTSGAAEYSLELPGEVFH